MNERKGWAVQVGMLGISILALLLASSLAGCCRPPEAPVMEPAGKITVSAGKKIAINAHAEDAEGYRWKSQGDGEISATEGETILYTAPTPPVEEGAMALVTVIAYDGECQSPESSLTIQVSQGPIRPGPIAIQPTQDNELEDKDCPIPGTRGVLQAQGTISLSGLTPGQKYRLSLNGWKDVLPNDELCKIDCTPEGEGFWDFDTEVVADEKGNVSQRQLQATLPSGVELYPDTTYKVKFLVKEGSPRYCTVLGHDEFRFTVESLE